ncbi:MAG: lantibiotic dehydratase [Oscillospiraceae bacterium]|nr:lantibiotic dehydratase [Oscillospiraceae bacterium]
MNATYQNKKYRVSDFYIARTPLLPMNSYYDLLVGGDTPDKIDGLIEKFRNGALSEALEIASESLSCSIQSESINHDSKQYQQIMSSLFKYYTRLTTRTTPFGLFAGVSLGRFEEENNMTVAHLESHKKRARPDMRWVYNLITKMEREESIQGLIRYRFNESAYQSGDRMERINGSNFQDQVSENEMYTSIKFSAAVKFVIKVAADWISFCDLKNLLVGEYPEVPENVLNSFLLQLIQNGFLLSELRPPLMNTDVLQYILSVLHDIESCDAVDQYIHSLSRIEDAIKEYNVSSSENGLEKYRYAIGQMKQLCPASNYLQVDMKSDMISNTLSQEEKVELEKFVYAIQRLAPASSMSDELIQYRDEFLEKYGADTEVAVLKLLDVDQGLGVPRNYPGSGFKNRKIQKKGKSEKEVRLEEVINRKVLLAIKNQQHSVSLSEDEIDDICGKDTEGQSKVSMNYPISFELFLFAHPRNKQSDYSFTVAPAAASTMYGKVFGRFRDMFSQEEADFYDATFSQVKDITPDFILAEISEFPSTSRVANVSCSTNGYDYQIAVNTSPCQGKKIIAIDDLYIGIDSATHQFYIKSKALDRRILVQRSNMLNPLYCSAVVRFLSEISSVYHYSPITAISKLTHIRYDYCPRIAIGKVIVSPEQWSLSKRSLGVTTRASFFLKFAEYKRSWGLPRFIYLNQSDNRLLLDTENELHVQEIWNAIKNSEAKIVLSEMTCGLGDHATRDLDGNSYVTEIVVPVLLNQKCVEGADVPKVVGKAKSNLSQNRMNIDRQKTVVLPGQENWLFFKLYGSSKRRNELISVLGGDLTQLVENKIASKFFYIRYSDPESHIRVRVQATSDNLLSLFQKMTAILERLQENGFISKYTIDTYQREVERYGGCKLIRDAEDYFFHDSQLAMTIIHKVRMEKASINLDYIGCSFIVLVLTTLGFSQKEMLSYLDSRVNRNSYRKDFQDNKKMLMSAVNIADAWEEIRSIPGYDVVYAELNKLNVELKKYLEAIIEADVAGELTSSPIRIAASIIHMFFNRLVGDNVWENKMYALARHSVYALDGYQRHRQK